MGENYLNSPISLISKSDIRYEGILYNINMEESSIALAQGEQAVLGAVWTRLATEVERSRCSSVFRDGGPARGRPAGAAQQRGV